MTSLTLAGAAAATTTAVTCPNRPMVMDRLPPLEATIRPDMLRTCRDRMSQREWVQDVLAHNGPIYLRIVNSLERTVRRGGLAPGQRLPSQRALAQQLGIDLTTVTRAFDEARKRGLIEARGPQGSFIAPPKAGFDQVVDLSMNVPPVPDADALAETLRRGAAAVLARSNAPNLMTYHLGGGNPTDRHAAARWLQPMLGAVDDASLLLTEGAQVALAAILVSQGRDDDAILCDALVYPGLLQAAAALGRRLLPVDSDEHGMCPEALARQARDSGARLVYLNPTCQNPTALTCRCSGAALAGAGARRPAGDRGRSVLAPCRGRDTAGGAGTAPCVLRGDAVEGDQPRPAHRVRALPQCRARRGDDSRAAGHPVDGPSAGVGAGQPAAAGWFGAIAAGAGAQRSTRAHAHGALSAGAVAAAACRGLHAWCRVPAPWTDATLVRTAQLQGLAIAPSSAFCPPGVQHQNGVRLSLGLAADRRQLEGALRRIDRLLLSDALPAIDR
jgi:DNA-binding transcriptional MocR family regulator